MNFKELFDWVSASKNEYELSKFDGDIFFYTDMVLFDTLKKKYQIVLLYPKDDPYRYWYFSNLSALESNSKKLYKKYLKNPAKLKKEFNAKKKKVLLANKVLFSSKQVDLKKYKKLVVSVKGFASIVMNTLEGLEKILGKELVKEFPDEKIRTVLSTSLYTSYAQSEEEALIKIIEQLPKNEFELLKTGEKDFKKYPVFSKKLKVHESNWGWAYSNYASHEFGLTKEIFQKSLSIVNNIEFDKLRFSGLEVKRSEKRTLIKKLSSKKRKIVELLDLLFQMRDERKETWIKITPPTKLFLGKFAVEHGLTYNDFRWLTFEEQISFEKNKEKYLSLINERKNGLVAFYGFGKENKLIFTGNDSEKFGEIFFKRESVLKLKGTPVSVGKATGEVCIIMNKSDFQKFKEGNILVSSHTTPDYLPLMKKASAILAERGGITSHAAIVSRELHIPCIVGIKGLVGNFKDGDLVEVDANKGIVKIIKNNEEIKRNSREFDFEGISKMKWRYIHKRFRTPFYMFLLFDGISNHYNKEFDFPYEIAGLVLDYELMLSQEDWDKQKVMALEKIKQNPSFCLDFTKKAYLQNEENLKLIKSMAKMDLASVSNASLADLLVNYSKKSMNISSFMVLPLLFEQDLEKNIHEAVEKKYGAKATGVMHTLTIPIKKTTTQLEENNILKLALLKKKNKLTLTQVEEHQAKYGWLKNTSFDGSFYSIREIQDKIDIASKSNLLEKLKHKKLEEEKQIKLFKKYRNSFKGSKIANSIDTLNELIFFRSWRTEIFSQNAQLLKEFFAQISKRIDLDNSTNLFYLTHLEIAKLLTDGKSAPSNLIEERKKGYFMFASKKSTIVGEGELLANLKKCMNIHSNEEVKDEIKGKSAFPGLVTGIVCIINSKADFAKVNSKNQIIVAFSTTPDQVPIIKKAAAIVTDEGGILSHASVISRELKIPCIIGTKNATKILKDGDLIEVDANKGIIKKKSN
ncbi:MAG: PEP-utilizing enzyme [archaeon]|jgi:phosphohistidine swiveling domain-containing protein